MSRKEIEGLFLSLRYSNVAKAYQRLVSYRGARITPFGEERLGSRLLVLSRDLAPDI